MVREVDNYDANESYSVSSIPEGGSSFFPFFCNRQPKQYKPSDQAGWVGDLLL